MRRLLVLTVFGFLAQLVDGALGMAYGATSTSLLLLVGLSPAVVSASVHLAEIGTTLVAGGAHARFGNVDWGIVGRLAVPGAVGAFLGATLLSSLSTAAARPITGTVLLVIGAWILVRFTIRPPRYESRRGSHGLRTRFIAPVGMIAGFIDATGGGGWGPVATPSLLITERVEPRRVVGTVDTSEFLVALAASAGFLLGLGRSGFSGDVVVALLIGGLVAAPLAAWVVARMPAALLGASVGGLLVLTNVDTLLRATAGSTGAWAADAAIVVVWALALRHAHGTYRSEHVAAEPHRPEDEPGLIST